MKRKQLSFDIDTKVAKAILGKSNYIKAYIDVRSFNMGVSIFNQMFSGNSSGRYIKRTFIIAAV